MRCGALLFAVLCAGCTGVIADPGASSDRNVVAPPGPVALDGDGQRLMRLTREQYVRSVQALLGDVDVDAGALPEDHRAGLFTSNQGVSLTDADVERYMLAAESIAEQVEARAAALLDCAAGEAPVACSARMIGRLGRLAFRRPLDPEEQSDYEAAFELELAESGEPSAVALVVTAILESPSFLYMPEPVDAAPAPLRGTEVATRLAAFLWQSGPDEALLSAAETGALDSPDGVRDIARGMLADARAEAAIRRFHSEWLGIDQLASVDRADPAFDAELAGAMREETERFALEVVWKGDGRLATLLGAPWSVIDARLAEHYGVPAPRADGFAVAPLEGRAGVLTHASVLTTHGSDAYTRPTLRGLFVRERLLCQSMPPPPASVQELVAERERELPEDATDRERLEALTGNEPCASCHGLMNPVGFALEAFDPIGRFRTADAAGPIDDTGELTGSGSFATDVDGALDGAIDLATRLADSDTVADCVTRQWMRFALGRMEEPTDEASIREAGEAFEVSGHDVRELVVALTATDSFRYRLPPTPLPSE